MISPSLEVEIPKSPGQATTLLWLQNHVNRRLWRSIPVSNLSSPTLSRAFCAPRHDVTRYGGRVPWRPFRGDEPGKGENNVSAFAPRPAKFHGVENLLIKQHLTMTGLLDCSNTCRRRVLEVDSTLRGGIQDPVNGVVHVYMLLLEVGIVVSYLVAGTEWRPSLQCCEDVLPARG